MPDSPYKHMDPYSDPIPDFVQTKERMKFKGEAPGVSGYLQQMLYGGGPPWWQRGFNQMVDMFVPENPMEVVPFGGTTKKGKSTYDYLADQFRPDEKLKKELLKGAPETSQKHKDPLSMMKSKMMSDDWGYKHAEFPQSKPTLKKSYDEPGEMKSLYDKPEWQPPVKEAADAHEAIDLSKAKRRFLDHEKKTWFYDPDEKKEWVDFVTKAHDEAYDKGMNLTISKGSDLLTDQAYRYIGFRESEFIPISDLVDVPFLKKDSRKDIFGRLEFDLQNRRLDKKLAKQIARYSNLGEKDIDYHDLQIWVRQALLKRLRRAKKMNDDKGQEWWDEKVSPIDFEIDFFPFND